MLICDKRSKQKCFPSNHLKSCCWKIRGGRLTIEPRLFGAGEASFLGGSDCTGVHLERLLGLGTSLARAIVPLSSGSRLHGALGLLTLGLVLRLGLLVVVVLTALATLLAMTFLGLLLVGTLGTSSVLVAVLVSVSLLLGGTGVALLAALVVHWLTALVIHSDFVVHFSLCF